jgi:hypothetical protein
VLHSRTELGLGRTGKGTSCAAQGGSVGGALGLLSIVPKGYGGCSVKNKVVRILADVSVAISPRMRRSFIDRQYSPLIGMDQSGLKIILEELTSM